MTVARGLQATVGATLRQGELDAGDATIPYFGPILGEAMLSYFFAESRGLVQLTGTYESSRYRDRAETRKVGDYFDLDFLATYHFTPLFKAIFAVDNISADYLERFDGYPLPSFVVRAGVGVRW